MLWGWLWAKEGTGGDMPAFDADSAWNYLQAQCQFGPRNPGSEGHRRCRDWLIGEARRRGGEVFVQTFSHRMPHNGELVELSNIVVRFGLGRPLLMLAAHWDTRPWADEDKDPRNHQTPILGANDGASGVAVLLEIMRMVSLQSPPRSLLFAFWDGEDLGRRGREEEFCVGSRHWVKHPTPELPDEVILLDMVGGRDSEFPWEYNSYSRTNRSRQMCETLWDKASDLGLREFIPKSGLAIYDDHIPFLEKRIPAIVIIDFDYPYWHTLGDTPEHCSKESLAAVGKALIAYLYDP